MAEVNRDQGLEQIQVQPLVSTLTKEEKLQLLVRAIASGSKQVISEKLKKQFFEDRLIDHDLEIYRIWLNDAHQYFREASQKKIPMTYASEWILDNYYIVRQALQQIEEDLPKSFFYQLPRIDLGNGKSVPRIYFITANILKFQSYLLGMIDLQNAIILLQEDISLTMGEIWALPIFLRFCLIEILSTALVANIQPQKVPDIPLRMSHPGNFDAVTSCGISTTEEMNSNDIVANVILGLRIIAERDWKDFFESVARIESILLKDPAGIYGTMDFDTRDQYRKEIELISFTSKQDENELAESLIELAKKYKKEKTGETDPRSHIGEFLLGQSRVEFENEINLKKNVRTSFNRWLDKNKAPLFIASILLTGSLLLFFLIKVDNFQEALRSVTDPASKIWGINPIGVRWLLLVLLTITVLTPVFSVATNLITWLATILLAPKKLPKLNLSKGIPTEFRTLVVIPGMIHNTQDVNSLAQQLELHYLRNPQSGIVFALLTDFWDSDTENNQEDEGLIEYAKNAIRELNLRHSYQSLQKEHSEEWTQSAFPLNTEPIFYFLHRKRLWNPSEGKWMGWERKRGKLHELNLFLSGKKGLTFSTLTDEMYEEINPLQNIRYVITLDADTILPTGAACRLVGTMAHPLNHAVFDKKTGQVVSGYTVLQPRMEIHPKSVNHSWFTKIFAGDTGLDLYTLAVSDAYQDLFGEGIYVGKGIYDVEAFTRSVNEHIPENTILSHDLLEGLMGRAGLVTDITLIEDYPQNYIIQVLRQRRWIRGDWQLLPWLFRAKKFNTQFTSIDRWKIIDNLRRSLLAPALMVLFLVGMIALPGSAIVWTGILLATLGIPILAGVVRGTSQTIHGESAKTAFRPLEFDIARWILAITFLPYEGYFCLDAIITTLYRLFISRKHLLQWTTAAQTTNLFGIHSRRNISWLKMNGVAAIGVGLAGIVQILYGAANRGVSPALIVALPILILWVFSPLVAWKINQPFINQKEPLDQRQIDQLRQLARRTWGFFERFVGPEDHWLPPDNFQESPVGVVAHRTSPTNIGLLLTSTLAAYDLGYLGQLNLATRLNTTIETLEQLERYKGHFLNWYDTLTMQPLNPKYISTVDSGNLAACLMITSQACKKMPDEPMFRWQQWLGYIDSLSNLADVLDEVQKGKHDQLIKTMQLKIESIRREVLSMESKRHLWYSLFIKASGEYWGELSKGLMELVKEGGKDLNLKTLEKLKEVLSQVERHHLAVQRTITHLVPWIPLFDQLPRLFSWPQYIQIFDVLRSYLPDNIAFGQVQYDIEKAQILINSLLVSLEGPIQEAPIKEDEDLLIEARGWLEKLSAALETAGKNTNMLKRQYDQIVKKATQFVEKMDFSFLYNPTRQVFHIGYNPATGQLDQNYYDLLASEARITSIIAIGKGDVPQTHWLHLGRPFTQVEDAYVLLSWSGTMFEYMMPALFLRSYTGTLLSDSVRGAVLRQIAYGKSKSVPWGISESGFYRFDSSQNYQYRAFGVPGLGFKRGLGDDLVIAPYASMMAVGIDPQAVMENLTEFKRSRIMGLFGLYESIDFTRERLVLNETSAVVKEYMAHHQGMVMMAMANFLTDNIKIDRMHSNPNIQSAELLLQEQIPRNIPVQNPYSEDVKGVQRFNNPSMEIIPWKVPVQTSIPQVNLLSNGTYNVVISNMGGGYSSWKDIDLTRWQSDGVLDPWGTWVYLQDMEGERKFWSASHQPVPGDTNTTLITFFAHSATYARIENGIASMMEVFVAPDDPVEIRRIHLHNSTDRKRRVRTTSYGEVILNAQNADARHPAFNKLFIESEFMPELNLQIFRRRPRSDHEAQIFAGHMLVAKEGHGTVWHEADRSQFIGRGRSYRNPQAMTSESYLTGSSGATFDPIFALGQEFTIDQYDGVDLAYLTLAAESREELVTLAKRYQSWTQIDRSFQQADQATQSWLGKQEISTKNFINSLQIISALLYPFKEARASSEVLSSNQLGQSGLWRFGISGDFPILLVEVEKSEQLDLVQELLQVHKYLHSRKFLFDLVIINREETDYGAELRGNLFRLITKMDGDNYLNQRGGIFMLHGDQMIHEEDILLKTAARVYLVGGNGSLSEQLPGYSTPIHHLPEFIPSRLVMEPEKQPSLEEDASRLAFYNGYGGFSPDGKEYILHKVPGKYTPTPWVNVIGYPQFGFMVSENGSQCTWAMNSGENRLTPWSNDPVSDPSGEMLYLRDEETGEVWTPTPLPAGKDQTFRVRHGAGYSVFEHHSHGIDQTLTLFASPEDPVKIVLLKVQNTLDTPRRITATYYAEWVMGISHANSKPYILPEFVANPECLLATNPYNSEFAARTAFLSASKKVHGFTADRTEFFGRGGTPSAPATFRRIGLEKRTKPGEDPCGALQVHLDLSACGAEEIYFVLGEASDRKQALALAKKYHDPDRVGTTFMKSQAFWDRLLSTVQVKTPNKGMDLILNRWMLYQTLSCRVWGRSGFYQSSGAFGFRDQLQDVLATLTIDPGITRSQILNAAQYQFEAGDVLHWWHPPSGRGVRTRFSDDLLWLPYVVAKYIESTNDLAILDEKLPYLQALPLSDQEEERYSEYPRTLSTYTLLDHCERAIEKGITTGPHKLPLIGTGDWNDGFNRIGKDGKGESVWLAWFISDVLNRFAVICEKKNHLESQKYYRERAAQYAEAVEKTSWDGAWYRRAYFDQGTAVGSAKNSECQIDAIAQSWAILSNMGDPERSRIAMHSVNDKLIRDEDRLSLLFWPPFNQSDQDPGYIKGYLPGIRENGGQYTHAATWTAWAFAQMGYGRRASELFDLLNPIYHSDTPEKVETYRVEPYVICADIYSTPPNVRRGGWSWYTGSAAWMYRLGLEGLLGFQKFGNSLSFHPTIPPEWDGYEVQYQYGESLYQIKVKNPEHVSSKVVQIILDDQLMIDSFIPLIKDKKTHRVEVILGK